MIRVIISIAILSLVIGCGTDDFLSRGEFDPFSGVDDIFEDVGKLSKADFDRHVLPNIKKDCVRCHIGKFNNYAGAVKRVTPGSPEKSLLYQLAGDPDHNGGVIWEYGSERSEILAKWIRGEAFEGGGGKKPPEEEVPVENLPSVEDFENVILPTLNKDCNMCHANPAPDYESALSIIEVGIPTKSILYRTSIGVDHMKVWSPDRPEVEALARWILLEDLGSL